MISNSRVKKRPRNWYGANVVGLGVFQTDHKQNKVRTKDRNQGFLLEKNV